MSTPINLYIDEKTKISSSPKAEDAKASASGTDVGNVLLFAFFLLTESVQIQSETAIVNAKGLSANAKYEQNVISEMRLAKWTNVPDVQKTVIHEKWWDWKHARWSHWTHTEVVNQGEIDAANAKNAQANKLRQDFQGQLSLLQQTAQVGDTMVNATVNESVKTSQEASSLLNMLKSLTTKILLHQ